MSEDCECFNVVICRKEALFGPPDRNCKYEEIERLRARVAVLEANRDYYVKKSCDLFARAERAEASEKAQLKVLNLAENAMLDAAQFIDAIRQEAIQDGWWTDWDQQMRDKITNALKARAAITKATERG